MRLRRVEAAQEGVDRALADGVARPAVPDRSFLGQPAADQVDQVAEGADLFAFDDGAAVVDLLRLFAQARRHVVDHDRVLLAVVLGVGEQEAQELLGAELVEGPEERGDRVVAAADVGGGAARVALGRRPELDALKRRRLEAEVHVAIELGGVLPDRLVGSIEEEEVLALDVEDQRLGVLGLAAEHPGVKERVEQEGGVGGLGGDAGDARDVDVRAASAVEELEVEIEALAVAREAGREPVLHPVEEQRLVAIGAGGAPHLVARARRHEHLGLEPRGHHHAGFGHLGRELPVLDQEHVAVEASSFVAGANLGDDAVDPDRLGRRRLAAGARARPRRRAGGTGSPRPRPRTRAASRPRCRSRVRPSAPTCW